MSLQLCERIFLFAMSGSQLIEFVLLLLDAAGGCR